MIALLVMTDGRGHCIEETIPAALEHLTPSYLITTRVIHDDSADPTYTAWLEETFPDWQVIGGSFRRGFGGAIQNAWAWLRAQAPEPYVFHLEDDFLIQRDVHLDRMAEVLRWQTHLHQLALLRGPVNKAERDAGGVIEQHPDDYRLGLQVGVGGWREHRRFWTTNPSLYRSTLMRRGWPDGADSEGHFGLELFAEDPQAHAAFWGTEGVWCDHVGHQRVGTGY